MVTFGFREWRARVARASVDARKRVQAGFTLLELIIVIAIIGILATIAMPALKDMPRRANESVLKTNLRTLRDLIDQYYGDQGHYPETLEVLVEKGYVRMIPYDPLTKSSATWKLILEEPDPLVDVPAETDQPEDGEPGIIDVRSGSPLIALDGTPYESW
ncbi:MAG: prepilin-type N-terminal cleavage/methylation domain-containing protein [Thermoanaerobaculia bacterium]